MSFVQSPYSRAQAGRGRSNTTRQSVLLQSSCSKGSLLIRGERVTEKQAHQSAASSFTVQSQVGEGQDM